ncbi:MAG: BBP7 family outer membrane beta-barrel protein, partial [Planctomycetales bacterium]|nr:BBP7 family outer membrane beta-barrel protein [Planctomycetales bacterium]
LTGECRFTNLYWCSPFGETYKDPCDFNTCSDCNFSEAPLWYASVEAVALARDQKDDLAFATLGAGGPVVLDTGDIKTEFDAGMRLLMGVTLTDVFRLEGSYLGSFEWSGRAAVRNGDDNGQGGFGNLFAPFSNFGTPVGFLGTDFNDFASIDLASSFHSGEINLRRRLIIPRNAWPKEQVPCYAASFLMGLRYLKLDEHFGYLSNSTVPAGGSVNLANIDTSNEMFGAQIGLLSQFLLKGQGWIDFDVKGGIYQNQASMRSAYSNTDLGGGPVAAFTGTDARDRTAFLGELSLTYNRQLTTHMSCRLGYNAFWLTGVALASQNLNTDLNLLALGPAQLDHSGDLVMHGPSFGLTFAY